MEIQSFSRKMQGLKVVYVEDDPGIRGYITEYISRYGAEVFEAEDGEVGLGIYQTINPDILILDINVPGKSGLEIAEIVRQNDHYTRILITTAYTDQEFMLKAVELRLTRYLVKPVTAQELRDALELCITQLEELSPQRFRIDLGGGYVFDSHERCLFLEGEAVQMRRKEIGLLELLIQNHGNVVTYESIENTLWYDQPMTLDALRGQVKNLRKKLERSMIENVSGIGYRLTLPSL